MDVKSKQCLSDTLLRQKACEMQREIGGKPERESGAILAFDPTSRETYSVRVSQRAILAAKRRNLGAVLECAYLVPNVLQTPRHVWTGLRWDDDAMFNDSPGWGPAWLSYCKIPSCSYREDGTQQAPRPNRVFMVCVNSDKIVYNWWWVPCDPRDPECPEQYDIRFRELLL
jgi:hypothetical protein